MYAAQGSGASIDDVVQCSSASVEILRNLSRSVTRWLGVNNPNRGQKEKDPRADILALCSSLKTSKVHTTQAGRQISAPGIKKRKKQRKEGVHTSGVVDVLELGRQKMQEGGAFARWKQSSRNGYCDAPDELDADDELDRDTAFDSPNGADGIDVEWTNDEGALRDAGMLDERDAEMEDVHEDDVIIDV